MIQTPLADNRIVTIPNILSFIRLLMIPFIAWVYCTQKYLAAVILVLISGLTDFLDGLIARKFHQVSKTGKILDPLADKLTMAAVVILLALHHPPMRLVCGMLIFKELMMLLGATVLLKKGKRPSESKIWGKVSTATLYCILVIVMASDVAFDISGMPLLPPEWMWTLAGVTCGLMMLALIQYYPIFIAIKNGKYNTETERFESEKAGK